MVPNKLKRRHLHTKHPHLREKPNEPFKGLTADQTRRAKQWTTITLSDKSQEGSYVVAEIVTEKDEIT
jgi:hypothetical protein